MMNNKIFLPIKSPTKLVGLFCVFLTFFSIGCFNNDKNISSMVVLQIDEAKLTSQEFSTQLAFYLKNYDSLSVKDYRIIKQVQDKILNQFIVSSITQSWANEEKIFVNSEELDAEVNLVRSNYPDDIAFRKSLTEQGLTFETWKQKIKESVLQKKAFNKITSNIEAPTTTEIKNYYNNNKEEFQTLEKVKIRQIVLDSESSAQKIYDEIKKGKSISELASKFSISPESKQGGDIGWISKGTLEVFEPAFKMKVGQKSGIVKSEWGYHIFEVTGKQNSGYESLKNAESTISKILLEAKRQEHYENWFEKQLRTKKVFRNDDLIKSIKIVTKE